MKGRIYRHGGGQK